jgi:hypothetical protein
MVTPTENWALCRTLANRNNWRGNFAVVLPTICLQQGTLAVLVDLMEGSLWSKRTRFFCQKREYQSTDPSPDFGDNNGIKRGIRLD